MLYFAYGSNLTSKQISKRCKSAQFVCRARLPNFRLAFTRFVASRKGGVADVVATPGSAVWGVVYEITKSDDVAELDKAEDYQPGRDTNTYDRISGIVEREGRAEDAIPVELYVIRKKENHCPPAPEYKKLIVNGAKERDLPIGYIEQLEQIEVSD